MRIERKTEVDVRVDPDRVTRVESTSTVIKRDKFVSLTPQDAERERDDDKYREYLKTAFDVISSGVVSAEGVLIAQNGLEHTDPVKVALGTGIVLGINYFAVPRAINHLLDARSLGKIRKEVKSKLSQHQRNG